MFSGFVYMSRLVKSPRWRGGIDICFFATLPPTLLLNYLVFLYFFPNILATALKYLPYINDCLCVIILERIEPYVAAFAQSQAALIE